MRELTPKQIVDELDKFIVGQGQAKQAIAIALRNRWRRRNINSSIKDDIYPRNILMIGPTGVGKTEIARRISKLYNAPFIKIEATKFTEIGYVGRDVDSIIKDLFDLAIKISRTQNCFLVQSKALSKSRSIILNCLVGEEASEKTKNFYLRKFDNGELDNKEIEIYIDDLPSKNSSFSTFDIPGVTGNQMGVININDILGKTLSSRKKKMTKFKVKDALRYILKQEIEKLVDESTVVEDAIDITENQGIVFIDEIDKITTKSDNKNSDVNREGVQRDLLPLIEGTTVNTKYGVIRTNHILFIASGAFHLNSPSDLLPELQGRLPIRVSLSPLSKKDLLKVLCNTNNSIPQQYVSLFKTEGISIKFCYDALEAIATYAFYINNTVENIGARRLNSVFEKILDKISFCADKFKGQKINIDLSFVEQNLNNFQFCRDYDKYIL